MQGRAHSLSQHSTKSTIEEAKSNYKARGEQGQESFPSTIHILRVLYKFLLFKPYLWRHNRNTAQTEEKPSYLPLQVLKEPSGLFQHPSPAQLGPITSLSSAPCGQGCTASPVQEHGSHLGLACTWGALLNCGARLHVGCARMECACMRGTFM